MRLYICFYVTDMLRTRTPSLLTMRIESYARKTSGRGRSDPALEKCCQEITVGSDITSSARLGTPRPDPPSQ